MSIYFFYLILYVIFSFFNNINATIEYNCNGTCAGLEISLEANNSSEISNYSENDEEEDSLDTSEIAALVGLRFATPCETPNDEVTLCIEISKCAVLFEVKNKLKYAPYINASRCGPTNENQNDFKVCCGKYNNFLNKNSKIILDDTSFSNSNRALIDDSLILPKQCGVQKMILKGRVYGGTEAVLGEYPWMARIIHKNAKNRKTYGCAGFLIHSKYVVTAAHCVISEFSDINGAPYSVLLGEHDTKTNIDCSRGGTYCADSPQRSRINTWVVHEKYVKASNNHHNDIALIYLNKGVKITDYVKPICLASQENPYIEKYYISGWGKTEFAEYSSIKLKTELKAFDRSLCNEQFNLIDLEIKESQICAGGEKLKDSCSGDSGGPLMIFNGSNYEAVGLVSYGVGCGTKGWPGIYTSIPYYLNWIKLQILDIATKSPKIKKIRKKAKKFN